MAVHTRKISGKLRHVQSEPRRKRRPDTKKTRTIYHNSSGKPNTATRPTNQYGWLFHRSRRLLQNRNRVMPSPSPSKTAASPWAVAPPFTTTVSHAQDVPNSTRTKWSDKPDQRDQASVAEWDEVYHFLHQSYQPSGDRHVNELPAAVFRQVILYS